MIHYALRFEPSAIAKLIRSALESNPAALADYETWLGRFHELTGVEFESEFLEGLGNELTFSISPQRLGESAPEGAIPVPALSVTWRLDAPEKVMQVLERVRTELLTPELPPEASEQERANVPTYRKVTQDGATLHLIDLPAASGIDQQTGHTVSPGYALIGDTLVIGSSEAVLTQAAALASKGGESYASAPARLRAAKAVGGDESLMLFEHVDLAGLARLVDGYAPLLAQLAPTPEPTGLERPEWPGPDGDMEAFQRAYEAYQRAVQEAKAKQAAKIEEAIHNGARTAARWFDFSAMGFGAAREGKMEGSAILKLR